MQTGDTIVIRSLNFYGFVLFLGILAMLVFEIIGFGLGYIGGSSTSGALTLLPPLITYSLFFMAFFLGCALIITHNTGVVPLLLALHFVALFHGIFFILVPGWNAWLDCVSATVPCDTTGIVLYSVGFISIILLMIAAFVALMAIWTYSQAQWRRSYMISYDEVTYRTLTGDENIEAIKPEEDTTTASSPPESTVDKDKNSDNGTTAEVEEDSESPTSTMAASNQQQQALIRRKK